MEQKKSKTNKRKVGKSIFPILLYDLLQSQIQSQEDKPSKSRKTNSGGKHTSKKLPKQKVSAYIIAYSHQLL